MQQETRDPETGTVEALLNAYTAGAVSRREFLRRAGVLGVTAAGAGALADAVAPARVEAQTTQKRELIVAQGGDISKFDPHLSTSANDIRVSFNIFDNLTSRHPDQKLHPALATEWKAAGPQTWTFKLGRASSGTTATRSPPRTRSSAWSGPTTRPPRRWSRPSSPPSIGSRPRIRSRW